MYMDLPNWSEVQESIEKSSDPKKAIKVYLLDDNFKEYYSKLNRLLVKEIKKKICCKKYMIYDSIGEGLEPIYFWLLDFMQDKGALGLAGLSGKEGITKVEEGFEASVAGGYFGEMGVRRTQMEAKTMEYLGAINQVIKSILNLIYDLKEFELLLKPYDEIKSEDNSLIENGRYSLKGRWMDNVDVKKGRGSINGMAQELQFITLRDAFFYVNTSKDADNLDLNDRVKRVLKNKLGEFERWVEVSEKELRKRFNVEKSYLKSQYGSFKLYSSWVMPYLRAAEKLKMKEFNRADVVNAFSNLYMELSLYGVKEIFMTELSHIYEKMDLDRKYYAVLEINIKFRSLPQLAQGQGGRHYIEGGRVDILYNGYSVDDIELHALDSVDTNEMLELIEKYLGTGLQDLEEDINTFINPIKEKKEANIEKKKVKFENPLVYVWKGFVEGFGSPVKLVKKEIKKLTSTEGLENFPDIYIDSSMRTLVEKVATDLCTLIYNTYKDAHGMIKP